MNSLDFDKFNPKLLKSNLPELFTVLDKTNSTEEARLKIAQMAHEMMFDTFNDYYSFNSGSITRVRDCAKVVVRMMTKRSEDRSRFSLAKTLMDINMGINRDDLSPAFFAEIYYLFSGLFGRGPGNKPADIHLTPTDLKGRKAALHRSDELDLLFDNVESFCNKYKSGLSDEIIQQRDKNKNRILEYKNADNRDWNNWNWHLANTFRRAKDISKIISISEETYEAIEKANHNKIPFGITPYYLSLMDKVSTNDKALRYQVIPPKYYVDHVITNKGKNMNLDFMLEEDTSPIDLITRRYPAICIFKPFNTCPQICVYCQRNWEIEDVMSRAAMASKLKIAAAIEWIKKHPSIKEVLVTGGDPLVMSDEKLESILNLLVEIESIERIRIGTRAFVTMPMRFTDNFINVISRILKAGKQVSFVTHIQHPYEITPQVVKAVQKIKTLGISIYNQLVYTFFVSRRFEATALRRILSSIGIDPYYTFNAKGKEETADYRVPIARLLQEQKEEARLLPGLSRTDEAVYNVPGHGKNYLRSDIHRDLISILPDGARVYEFHQWERSVTKNQETYISKDMPILPYLERLAREGENVNDYDTIWYFY